MQRFFLTFLAISFLMMASVLPASSSEAEVLTLEVPEHIRPYARQEITLSLPQGGVLSLHAVIGGESLPLFHQGAVAGKLVLPFWGLTMNGEPLPRAQASILARLENDGQILEAKIETRVLNPAAGLLYALLSRDSLPVSGKDDLYIDHQLSRAGSLLVSLYAAQNPETPLFARSYERKDALPHTYRWDKTINGKPAPAGEYFFELSVRGSQQEALIRPFTLTEALQEDIPVQVNPPGTFLPADLSDRAVWQAMMAPLYVLDIGDMQHQDIFELPDKDSLVLGMVHGQTAGLEVLELGLNGYARVRTARHGDGQIIVGYVPENKLITRQPHPRYGLLVDKAGQVLTVYEEGRPLGSIRVSTGVYVPPGSDSIDTLQGAFLTQDRIAVFNSEGFWYAYATRIDGGNLIHSAGYKTLSGVPDFSAQQAELGRPASHGCVRVDNLMSSEGLNAWWLYANLPRNTKVLVLGETHSLTEDVPGIKAGEAASITTQTPEPMASPSPAGYPSFQVLEESDLSGQPFFEPLPVGMTRIVLTFGGDCVLGSEEQSRELPESFYSIIETQGEAWPFSGLEEVFQNDDLTMVNLENVLKDNAQGLDPQLHNFRGPSSFANILKLGGVDLVNLANNHFPDYGQDGKNSTRAALRAVGIPYAGYSSLYVYEKDGVKIGFAGIRETVFHQNRTRISDEISQLKRQGCDYIVYTCHFGNEYEKHHNKLQTLMAHTAIDAGANLVIGHHTHIVQGLEEYKGGLIFYSLGNLVFGGNLELSTFDGLLAQVQLDFEGETLIQTTARLIPVITSGIRPQNDFRPFLAQGEDKVHIMNTLNQDSQKEYPEIFVLQ